MPLLAWDSAPNPRRTYTLTVIRSSGILTGVLSQRQYRAERMTLIRPSEAII
jgi:hypothetical protein